MLAYLDQRNKNPKPFVWTADTARSRDFLYVVLAQDTSGATIRRGYRALRATGKPHSRQPTGDGNARLSGPTESQSRLSRGQTRI